MNGPCEEKAGRAASPGLDTRGAPRQFMLKTCKTPRDHGFSGRSALMKAAVRAEAIPPRDALAPEVEPAREQVCRSIGTVFVHSPGQACPRFLGERTVEPSLTPVTEMRRHGLGPGHA
jgi:hypothetical protein